MSVDPDWKKFFNPNQGETDIDLDGGKECIGNFLGYTTTLLYK